MTRYIEQYFSKVFFASTEARRDSFLLMRFLIIPRQYKDMSEGLAMDEVLTDVARRMFLERLLCPDMAA